KSGRCTLICPKVPPAWPARPSVWATEPHTRTGTKSRPDPRLAAGDGDTRPVTMAREIRGGERGPGGASLAPDGGHRGAPRTDHLASSSRPTGQEASANRMLRLLHTADVHLGARHADLGDAATSQRERQFAAFKTSIDLAIDQKVDLFIVAGDL